MAAMKRKAAYEASASVMAKENRENENESSKISGGLKMASEINKRK